MLLLAWLATLKYAQLEEIRQTVYDNPIMF